MEFENNLRKKLDEGKTVYGPFVKFSNPAVVEVLGYAGFDFVIIDLEHGPLTMEAAENLVRAAQLAAMIPIIRVTDNDPTKISRALDIGANGIQVPQICSKVDAEKTVRAAKFGPRGERGVCRFVRAANYSAVERSQYFQRANADTIVVVQIEGLEGVQNIKEVLSVPGIDVIFLGPYDMSQSLGVIGQVNHPAVVAKLKAVTLQAKEKGVAVGTFVETIEEAHRWQEIGMQYISYSVDTGILYQASQSIVDTLHKHK